MRQIVEGIIQLEKFKKQKLNSCQVDGNEVLVMSHLLVNSI